ncbi:MAG: threonine/serine exporter family protein [Muribaculaceae bacterium]|nr:threonine/serine exporter family protein [Muribaculaceae bacterium]
MTLPDRAIQDIDDDAGFLAEYAAWLWGCGATCTRLERNVMRMARALGADADLLVLPGHVELAVTPAGGGAAVVAVRKMNSCGIRFDLNAALSRLSWELADGRIAPSEARVRFRKIISAPPTPAVEVVLMASVANAAFCRLFGGDLAAMITVLFATLAGLRLKQLMMGEGHDVRVAVLCAAFASATLSAGASLFGWGTTPGIALGTSVLYLIPGVPYINAVSDMLGRHYLCAFSRFMDACVLTACLTAGLTAGMFILGINSSVL